MKRIQYIELVYLFIICALSQNGIAQQASNNGNISEGNLKISFLSSRILRIQLYPDASFNTFSLPEKYQENLNIKILRHEDRLRVESPLFTFFHNPQPGLSETITPRIKTVFFSDEIFPLDVIPLSFSNINRGVLIIDNLEEQLLHVNNGVLFDRIVIITNNNFIDQIEVLKEITGDNINIPKTCPTPQIFFKPVNGKALLQIESSPGATIYFTRDGSTPNYLSEKYTEPQLLKTSARVLAFATADKYLPSKIGKAQIVMSKAREIVWRHDYSEKYCGLGEYALMDGLSGDPDNYNLNWIGIPDNDMSVEVELNKPMTISMLGIRFLQQPVAGIFVPEKMTIEVSCDGRRYQRVYRHKVKPPDAPYHHWTHTITARFRPRDVKYIRIHAEADEDIKAENHFLEGSQWIFVDEILYEQHPDKEDSKGCEREK